MASEDNSLLVPHILYIVGKFNSVSVLNSKYFSVPNITTLPQTFFKTFAFFLGTVSDQTNAGDIH